MIRPEQHIHPHREPAPVWPAATILLLRDAPTGLEVLMTRRSEHASFAPGVYVFPGGRIDQADAAAESIAMRRPTQSKEQLIEAIAAVRETFEELGVLLAHRPGGAPSGPEDIAALDRKADPAAFFQACATRGLRLATHEVYTLAHWITDRDMPKRFDVPFLAARMPAGQEPVADQAEQFEPCWVQPADALARHAENRFAIIFPTVRTLQWLTAFSTVDAVLAACAHEKPLWTSCPRAGLSGKNVERYMEHEPPYGELMLVCPDGQIKHSVDWQHDEPVRLLKNVQRLTAPNPSPMTGPGTNSYLVGDANTGYIAIDPGPDDAGHVQRLWRAAGGDIRLIVCTHSHPDHAPGAFLLQNLCPQRPPVLGLPSAPTARPSARFTPERAPADGERLVLRGASSDGQAITHTLRVVHTPGHAANHLCLVREEDGLLFSGDHILSGSTTVIDPPDGDMSDYLDSLDRLDAACAEGGIEFILPAHGYVIANARDAIARLKAHRLQRESRVAQAMRERPQGTMEDWLALAYDDVPQAIWPVAMRSLTAHVQRIRELASSPGGRVRA